MRKQGNNRLSTVCVDWREADLSYDGRIMSRKNIVYNNYLKGVSSLFASGELLMVLDARLYQYYRNNDSEPLRIL
jgi:hypothetical protein